VCHNGKTFHMIAPSSYSGPNQFRISLQGHGGFTGSMMQEYLKYYQDYLYLYQMKYH
jgi:hypothetical protein